MSSNFIELDGLPIHTNLEEELDRIVGLSFQQCCLNAPPGHEDDIFFGVGSLKYDWDKSTINPDGSTNVPLRDKVLLESNFTELCNVFRGTVFEDIYSSIKKKYDIGRVRIMILNPRNCLSWHVDGLNRVHYPIKTKEGCYMVIEDEVKHLEQNKWYFTKTLKPHTVFNGSNDKRIHLVVTVYQ